MNAIIVEDEHIARTKLVKMLSERDSEIDILAEFESLEETVEYFREKEHPEILFLDINLSDGLSLELFNEVDIDSHVIFTTAHDEYAVEAFRKNALDYLLKPIKYEELSEALSRVRNLRETKDGSAAQTRKYKERFLVHFSHKLYSVNTDEIAYLYSENKIVYIITKENKRIPTGYILKDIIEELDPAKFFRANRQFIIHIDAIEEMRVHSKSRVRLYLKPAYDGEIVISTDRTRIFKDWLEN